MIFFRTAYRPYLPTSPLERLHARVKLIAHNRRYARYRHPGKQKLGTSPDLCLNWKAQTAPYLGVRMQVSGKFSRPGAYRP